MGGLCGSEKPKRKNDNNIPLNFSNNFNNSQINPIYKKIPIDPRLYNVGAKYLIRQSKQEQYEGNIPGGKMPIKLIFSLDKEFVNINYNPSLLTFQVSFSDINYPNEFKGKTLINELNQVEMCYSQQIITDYYFEFDQKIKIMILYNNKNIGETSISSSKINGSRNHTEEIPISINNNQQQDFKLIIVSDPIEEELSRVAVCFEMRMENNDNMEYFAVFENTYNNKHQSIYKTEEINGPFPKIMAMDIAFGDLSFDKSNDQEFDIVFYKKINNSIDKIGKVVYSLKNLDNMSYDIINENGSVMGKVSISSTKRTVKRFVDYIYSGLQIGLSCAVDFTASNGNVNQPSSLHYINSVEPNQYEQSIRAAAGIIAYYDSDKLFPCYGFGAEYNGQISHCFNLSLTNQSELEGIDGIMNSYKNAINSVALSGPTFFSPVIYKTIQDIKTKGIENNYYILLIITDGKITDEEPTRKAIVEASILPLSIVIVGVGNSDFSSMNRLDGDESPLLDSRGRRVRDIVQFVHYNQNFALNASLFSKELLYEIPGQVEGYFRSIGK